MSASSSYARMHVCTCTCTCHMYMHICTCAYVTYARDWSHKAREARARGGAAREGYVPPGKFLISDLLSSLLVPFRGEPARVGRPTSNLIIVFERSHNLKAWLRFAPRRGEKFLASYCMYSFSRCSVELRDTNTVCHRILSYLLWYSTMVSVGRSVRSYICADLLNTREGSPSKGGVHLHPPYPPWIRHWIAFTGC